MSTPALQQECPVSSDINILENTQIQNDCQNEKYNHQNFRPFLNPGGDDMTEEQMK